MNRLPPQFGLRHILALVFLAAVLLAGFQFLAAQVPDLFVFACIVVLAIGLGGTFILLLAAFIALSIKLRPAIHRAGDQQIQCVESANGYLKCWNLVAIGTLMIVPSITAICALPFLRTH